MMKHKPPTHENRLLITNICSTLQLSAQTLHNTIKILMHPNLQSLITNCNPLSPTPSTSLPSSSISGFSVPQMGCDTLTCLTVLFISQKMHEVQPYSIKQLCFQYHSNYFNFQRENHNDNKNKNEYEYENENGSDNDGISQMHMQMQMEKMILEMEVQVMQRIGWKFFNNGLIIDQCFHIASQWDLFVFGVSCIRVRFLNINGMEKDSDSLKENQLNQAILRYCQKSVQQTCERLSYISQTYNFDIVKLSLSIIILCISKYIFHKIEQAQRFESKLMQHPNPNTKPQNYNNKCKSKVNPHINSSQSLKKESFMFELIDQQKQNRPRPQESDQVEAVQKGKETQRAQGAQGAQRETIKMLSKSKMRKMGIREHSSTSIIISDFVKEVYDMEISELEEELEYVKGCVGGLREFGTHLYHENRCESKNKGTFKKSNRSQKRLSKSSKDIRESRATANSRSSNRINKNQKN